MTPFNSITASIESARSAGRPVAGAPSVRSEAAAISGKQISPLTSSDSPIAPDAAQRLARRSSESLPQTRQFLESLSEDVALVESIEQAAGVLSEAANRAPAFDAAGVSAALATIAFALEQGQEYADRLKLSLPSLNELSQLTPEGLASNPVSVQDTLTRLRDEAGNTRTRLTGLAEELAQRSQRIAQRVDKQPAASAVADALQAQSRQSLASVALPPGGQSQVSRLLSDLGLAQPARIATVGAAVATASTVSTQSVATLVSRLQKQFPDVT